MADWTGDEWCDACERYTERQPIPEWEQAWRRACGDHSTTYCVSCEERKQR